MKQKPQARQKSSSRKMSPPAVGENFLIAAIGASAGGVEAFGELMRHLPPDTGMAFVLIQHLDPTHHSILTDLLARETSMHVAEVTDGMRVEPDCAYVIPPNASMSISDHVLSIRPRGESTRGAHMPIDAFMRSLAQAHGDRAIGVILSGTGTDGTLGMAEIQAQGGVTFAQEETSAKYDGMPRSAISAGNVDYVLPPKGIARELASIARHPYSARAASGDGADIPLAESHSLDSIFQQLRRQTGVDFTHYRKTTILRRIRRRMVVHKLEKLQDYVRYLNTNQGEISALYQDMLINVTSFFRNPEVFDALKSTVFPVLCKSRAPEATLRIWVPACASGEEIYSVAIALLEYLGDNAPNVPIQFFGTDVSETSVDKARSGTYPENIQGDVSPERLRRFFTKVDGSYRISKTIRDMCVFAQHNLTDDPPFSQMDLVCCRNLLIYLEPILQTKVISLFHYALRTSGFLVLGTSEGVGAAANLFASEDRAHKIFLKKAAARQLVTFSLNRQSEREYGQTFAPSRQRDSTWSFMEAQKEFDRRLISQYVPATAFLNEELEVIHSRGNINRYLKLPSGSASLSVLKMAREGLFRELRDALAKARKEKTSVRRQGIRMKTGNGDSGAVNAPEASRLVNFEVVSISFGKPENNYFMLIFDEIVPELVPGKASLAASESKHKQPDEAPGRLAKLEQELAATKEYLQSIIETHEATNEELQSANEEILSSNEELQSTNEELETAKEELQSANEELSTVNDELRNRNAEMTQINADLTNLLASIDIAVLMVGKDLTIRRFSLLAQQLLGLIPGDTGRPLTNISPLINPPNFRTLVLQVMADSRTVEKEVDGPNNAKYLLRVLPYRTAENKTEGAVITFFDLSAKR